MKSQWQTFLRSRYARTITPLALFVLTSVYGLLLLRAPFWLAFLPCVIVAHRIGILLHEFIHGIPFRRYLHNHNLVTLFDGGMLMWGTMEVFRGTHLAHHRWLNTDLDPARESDRRTRGQGWIATLAALEAFQSLAYLRDALAGKKPYVRRLRIVCAFLLSVAVVLLWVRAGHPEVIWKMLVVNLYTTLVPISFRGAVEHYSLPDDLGSTNEYGVCLPLFNLNRHIHHHEEPHLPWYLLEFKTANPLAHWYYFTHWFRVYVTHDLVLMQPKPRRSDPAPSCKAWHTRHSPRPGVSQDGIT